MTVLVTGGKGFIGGHLLRDLIRQGRTVRTLVRPDSQAPSLPDSGASVAVGDVRQADAVRRAVEGTDVVFHCAAAVGPNYSHQDVYDINLNGTRNVLEALRQQGSGRLILVSSINVLGIRSFDQANEEVPCRRSGDPHADVKIDAELLCQKYQQEHGVKTVIVRPALVYGPGEKNIPRLIDAIGRGKFRFLGSRDHLTPMVHINDLVQAMSLAADTPAAAGRIYHITDGARTTIGQLIDYLAELTKSPKPAKVLPTVVPATACRVFELLKALKLWKKPPPISRVSLRFLATSRGVDISRARRELGYVPRVAFREGMAEYVAWILKQNENQAHAA